jgi:hypothetical protein
VQLISHTVDVRKKREEPKLFSDCRQSLDRKVEAFSRAAVSCICRKLAHKNGAGAESRGSTLTAEQGSKSGRATLDAATRNILDCVSSGNTLLTCPPGEGKALVRLCAQH